MPRKPFVVNETVREKVRHLAGGSDALTHGVLGRRFAQGATTDLPQSPENRRLGGPTVRISFPPARSLLRT
jgi:hypothetical protein